MHQKQDASAGDKAIRNIKYGEIHKLGFQHIHNISPENPVDHIAQSTAVNGSDAPAFKLSKGQGAFEIFQND